MKIIPAIDLMDGQVVRLHKGDPTQKTVYSTNPIEVAKKWEASGADMLHIVDLDATLGNGSNLSIIKKMLSEISIPVEVAGGLRNEALIFEVAKISTRIVIGTLAFTNKELLKKLSSSLGFEKIVISVDHNAGKIVTHGWQQNTEIKLIESMKEFLEMGFTEFLLTNVSRDGTMKGPDLEFLELASSLDQTNVIASGGISNINDVMNVKEKKLLELYLEKLFMKIKFLLRRQQK